MHSLSGSRTTFAMAPRTRQWLRPLATVTRVQAFCSDLGWIAAAWHDTQLCALTFGYSSAQQAVGALGLPDGAPSPARTAARDPFTQRLQAYAQGRSDDFRDVPVALEGFTEFQRRVLKGCRRIACGTTVTYAELAARCGAPRAARAVGGVLARNRIPLVIPCHRVVGSHGALGGFSAPQGISMKRRLLTLEHNAPWVPSSE
jgi:methylated-DNA-[protein]-cysteine S-methyltransferase